MARYDRSYDYGLRGYRETAGPSGRGARPRAWGDQDVTYPQRPAGGYSNRVTASYNRDYTYDRPYRGNERNFNPYGGDRIGRIGRIGDMQDYLHMYNTRAGTHTSRGGYWPQRDPFQDDMRYGYDRDLRRRRNF